MRNRTLAIPMVLALAGGLALGQPGPGATPPTPAAKPQAPMACGMQGMQGMKGMQAMMPDLTPDQLEKMDALREANLKEMLPIRTDLEIKRIELEALWRADEPDAKKIVAKVKEIGDLQEKMEVARINHMFDIRNLLTPEQRKAMRKMGPGMMGGRRGRGMMRGRMGGCPMGGDGCGMQGGNQCCGPQGPMGQGCPDCDMH